MQPIDAIALKEHICNMCDDGERECKGDESCAILCWVNDMPTIEPIYPQWISVNKELPEVGQFVLVYYTEWHSDVIQVGMLESDRLNFDILGEFCFPVNKVTHWMPLPEKPEVKNDDN